MYTDPGKIKSYLAAGLVVLTTSVPKIARAIKQKRCGAVTAFDPEDIAKFALRILGSKHTMETYSRNSRKYAEAFNWPEIYGQAITKTLALL